MCLIYSLVSPAGSLFFVSLLVLLSSSVMFFVSLLVLLSSSVREGKSRTLGVVFQQGLVSCQVRHCCTITTTSSNLLFLISHCNIVQQLQCNDCKQGHIEISKRVVTCAKAPQPATWERPMATLLCWRSLSFMLWQSRVPGGFCPQMVHWHCMHRSGSHSRSAPTGIGT